MGHIIASKELRKPLETNNNHITTSSTHSSLLTSTSSNFSSQNGASPAGPPSKLGRRFLTYFGCNWNECVQGVASILPPLYADRWLRCLEQLMHNEGPLPETWRIYIAIMALCRHEVTWAVRALTFEFVSCDGDRKWLSGLRFAPRKLQSLSFINKILAHRPWLLTSQHILDLTKGEGSWSMSELCQALCLMTHFHAFASFLHSCLPHPPATSLNSSPTTSPQPSQAVSPRPSYLPSSPISLPLSPKTLSPSKSQPLPSSLPDKLKDISKTASKVLSQGNVNGILIKETHVVQAKVTSNGHTASEFASSTSVPVTPIKSTPLLSLPQSSHSGEQNGSLLGDTTGEGKSSAAATAGSKREIQTSPQPSKQSKNDARGTRSSSSSSNGFRDEMPSCLREFPHLCSDISFSYQDFPANAPPSSILKVRDFNWGDHGYSVMTRLLSEMSNVIDDRFWAARNLSHPAWVTNNDAAYHFRRAVWNYVQSLFGIVHDDYIYSHIDVHLTEQVKCFIKRSCCRPDSLEGGIPNGLLTAGVGTPTSPHPPQLVPLSILVMEARIEAELLFALKAFLPHQR